MASVRIEGVSKRFAELSVISDLDFRIAEGEFVVFVGPSGCGKSTLLRMIAGLEDVSGGQIWIGDRDVTDVDPAKRGVAMVFQSYALYPHMTVRDNMGFALTLDGTSATEREQRVMEAARTLKIEHLIGRKPGQLSGGQRQRVAIGRAIVRDPDVFLFDEPLSNLDAALRSEMRMELARLHQRLGATMIYVTHDQVEAMTLADTIVVLDRGRIQQSGNPMTVYEHPANLFVATFIGSPKMNVIDVTINRIGDSRIEVSHPDIPSLAIAGDVDDEKPGDTIKLGVRPIDIAFDTAEDGIAAKVCFVERHGDQTIVNCETENGLVLNVAIPRNAQAVSDQRCRLQLNAARCHLFGTDGRLITKAE
jgi:multiple sugar transport system ATP-binding protein